MDYYNINKCMSDTTPLLCSFPEAFTVPEYSVDEKTVREIWENAHDENEGSDAFKDQILEKEPVSHNSELVTPRTHQLEAQANADNEFADISEMEMNRSSYFGDEIDYLSGTSISNKTDQENESNLNSQPIQVTQRGKKIRVESEKSELHDSTASYSDKAPEYTPDHYVLPTDQDNSPQTEENTVKLSNIEGISVPYTLIHGRIPLPLFHLRFFYLNGHAHIHEPYILPLSELFKYNAWPGEAHKGCFWRWIGEVLEMKQEAGDDVIENDHSYSGRLNYSNRTSDNLRSSIYESNYSDIKEAESGGPFSGPNPSSQINKSVPLLYTKCTVNQFFRVLFCRRLIFLVFDQDKLLSERFDEDWMIGLDWEEKKIIREGWKWFRMF